MIEAELLILAIVNMAEGVKSLIGDKGAKDIMRDTGKQAGSKLLESLIGRFPENLPRDEALRRTCKILENLGFSKSIKIEEGRVIVEEDIFTDAIVGEDLLNSPVVYFFAGLIEGFVSFMSDQKVILTPEKVVRGRIVYRFT